MIYLSMTYSVTWYGYWIHITKHDLRHTGTDGFNTPDKTQFLYLLDEQLRSFFRALQDYVNKRHMKSRDQLVRSNTDDANSLEKVRSCDTYPINRVYFCEL